MTNPTACREAFDRGFEGTNPEGVGLNNTDTLREFVYQAWKDATIKANTRAPEGEAVAWLKEWTDSEGEPCRRVDLYDYCEPWLNAIGPKITPLYTHPRATSAEVDGCQMLPKGWRIEVRDNGVNKGMCVFSPDGCFVVSGDTDHKSDIRKHVIELLDAALANRGEVG